jgi:hypothetical protein
MPYKDKAESNAAARRRWAEDPSVRERHKVAQDRWEEENHKERSTYRARWAQMDRVENIVIYHERELARDMKKYGTTVEWYRDRLIEQCGLCALCRHLSHHHGTIQRLQVDHDHGCCDLHTKSCGKCLRGLLCADCNILLSYLEKIYKDCFEILPNEDSWTDKALHYIDHYRIQA